MELYIIINIKNLNFQNKLISEDINKDINYVKI